MIKAQMTLYSYFLTAMVTILWGFNFVFAKVALQHFEPFTMLVLRFLIIAILLGPFFRTPPIAISRIIYLSFTFSILHLGTMFWSLNKGIDAGTGIIALQTHVPFLLILGIIFFNDKFGIESAIGIILSFIGSVLLMQAPNSIANPFAFFLMIFSAFSVAIYGVQLKKLENVNTVALITWIAISSIPMMLPFALFFEDNHINMILTADIKVIASLLYVTIGSAIIGHSLWAYLLARNPVSAIAPITLLIPVIGVLGGALFLDETLSLVMIIGAILMIIGVGIVIIRRPKMVELEVDL